MERERFLISWQLRGGFFPLAVDQAARAVPAGKPQGPPGHEAQGRLTWRVTSYQVLLLKSQSGRVRMRPWVPDPASYGQDRGQPEEGEQGLWDLWLC